jgi:predicted Zn-dependent protease
MIKERFFILLFLLPFATGCDSLNRWRSAGTHAIVSLIPRTVDQTLGEAAQRGQTFEDSTKDLPKDAHQLMGRLAEPLVKNIQIAPLEPVVRVMKSETPNAFALPHGGVFVTTKLIEISKSPEEILAVLSHELAHVVQRHSMQQLLTQVGTSLAISAVFGDLGTLSDLAGAGGQLLGLKFSRDHEREADMLGADILRRAGLPLSGMASFFETMQTYEKSRSELPSDNTIMNFLRTHPATDERIASAKELRSEKTAVVPPNLRDAYQSLKNLLK